MFNFRHLLLFFVLLISACGGGGGGTSAVSVSGQFLSSYVKGVKVCTDSGYCTLTDSQGRFYLEVKTLPVHITFFVGDLKLGDYNLSQNGEIVTPFRIAGNSQLGDILARFIHGMAGDSDGSFETLNFSQVRVLDSNVPDGESLTDAIESGNDVRVDLINDSGEEYSVEFTPESMAVKLCSADGCKYVNYRQWLFLVYMAADNSLNDFALLDLKEMAAVKINPQVKLVVLTDLLSGEDRVTESDEVTGDLVTYPLSGEVDSGSFETLEDFVDTFYEKYPAKNVALILWDHGDGWRSSRTAAFDDTNSTFLLMFQLRKALSDLSNRGVRFNIIGFDECLMGMEEVLFDVKDFTDYVIASESYEPGTGWNYQEILSFLLSNPQAIPEELGRAIVDAYRQTYSSEENDTTLTLALFSRGDVERIAKDLDNLYQDLNNQTFPDFQTARDSAQQVACSSGDDCSYYYIDLYSFASKLAGKYPAAADIVSTLNSVYKTIIPGSDNKEFHGLSIYFPSSWTEAENSWYTCYVRETPTTCVFGNVQIDGYYNPFAAQTDWDEFLENYLSME